MARATITVESVAVAEEPGRYGYRSEDDGTLILRLPFPPSVNDYKVPRPGRRGVYYLTARAVRFRAGVQMLCMGAPRFGGVELELDTVLHPPDARPRDADNFGSKALWDALQAAGIFDDDKQVQRFTVTKGEVVRGGLVIVKVWPYTRRVA